MNKIADKKGVCNLWHWSPQWPILMFLFDNDAISSTTLVVICPIFISHLKHDKTAEHEASREQVVFNGHFSAIIRYRTEIKQENPADADKPARRESMQKLLQFDVFRFISPNSISPNFTLRNTDAQRRAVGPMFRL